MSIPLKASVVLTRVRQVLDQVPYSDEAVGTDSMVMGSNSTNFSDQNLLERINDAQRAIVARVKAMHVPNAIHRYDTAFGDTLPDIALEYDRLLYSRVLYTGATGDPNNTAPYDPQGYFDGTPDYPDIVYQLIAGRHITVTDIALTTGTNPTTNTSLLVTVDGTSVATIAVNTSGTHVTTIGGGSFEIETGQIMKIEVGGAGFDAADLTFSFTATAEVFTADTVEGIRAIQRSVDRNRRMQNTVGANGETPGRAASGNFPVYTFEDGELNVFPNATSVAAFFVESPQDISYTNYVNGEDYLFIPEKLELACVAWVCASCYNTQRNTGMEELHMALYEDEIDPYVLENRYNRLINDREVDVE